MRKKNKNKDKDVSLKLASVPTVIDESRKIIDSKNRSDIQVLGNNIKNRELSRKELDKKAILELINNKTSTNFPLTRRMAIERATYQEALKNLVNLQDPEVLEAMMLLYEYMYKKKTFKLDKITGTELLKLSGHKEIRQKHRHAILSKILKNRKVSIEILDPEKSIKNYKNKKTNEGLEYNFYDLLRIKTVVYSKADDETIVALKNIEFLPVYIEHIHKISKRYLPLESIRKIPKNNSQDKSRHFIYKICFKFASMKGRECELNLEECMNIGQFFSRNDRAIARKWQRIEKALLTAKNLDIINFDWTFKLPTSKQIKKDNLEVNNFNEIINPSYSEDGKLNDIFYKYIDTVIIRRAYSLNQKTIILPIEIEEKEPTKSYKPLQI